MKNIEHIQIIPMGSFFDTDENGFIINPTHKKHYEQFWYLATWRD